MKQLFCIIFFVLTFFATAQDIHFSQVNITKSILNPSLAGYQDNDFQLQFQRRSQWASVSIPFVTSSIAFDAKEIIPTHSVGLHFLNDVAGDSHFSTSGLNFSYSKKWHIGGKGNNISFGGLMGAFQRKIDFSALIFEDNTETLINQSFMFLDFGIGTVYEYNIDKRTTLLSGVSVYHFNRPKQSLMGNNDVFLHEKYNAHATIIYLITPKFQLKPTVYYNQQLKDHEFLLGSGFNYLLSDISPQTIVLRSVIYNRWNDAFIVAFGIKINHFESMVSYDINTSSLANASNNQGGVEFSIVYQWDMITKEKEIQTKQCPKYL